MFDFEGFNISEIVEFNFFIDYWVNVIFLSGLIEYCVFVYYVVDGNVVELSVDEGSIWWVYFIFD